MAPVQAKPPAPQALAGTGRMPRLPRKPAPAWQRLLRRGRWGTLALLLVAFLAALLAAHQAAQHRQAPAYLAQTARQRALDDAATLLALPAGRGGSATRVALALAEPALEPYRASGAAAPAPGTPPVGALAESAASAAAVPRPAGLAGAPPGRARIPDTIEGSSALSSGTDALMSLTINARLRVVDGRGGPFRLLATRPGDDGGPARAQLQRRGATAAWFERGESPAPGWQLVDISPSDVLLLTPQGNPMRLTRDASEPGPAPGAPPH